MISVIMFKADDGSIHETREKALEADNAYWKALGMKQLEWEKKDEETRRKRMPYTEAGGHQ